MNNSNKMYLLLMKEFEEKRKETRKEIEKDINWRKVPLEVKELFYKSYDYTNKISDEVVDIIKNSEEVFDYLSEDYIRFINMEEGWYDFIYYILCKNYGIDNCFLL